MSDEKAKPFLLVTRSLRSAGGGAILRLPESAAGAVAQTVPPSVALHGDRLSLARQYNAEIGLPEEMAVTR